MNTFPSDIQDIEVQRLRLEKLCQPTPAQKLTTVSGRWLRQAGQWLVKALTEGDQLRIRTQSTQQGTVWHVHDPIGGTDHMFASEEGLRTWLEQRYSL
ncbi:hypothetical protein [Leptothoe kymatousa]|uniref:Uncharacterized protein n=1 Tax=Leptothoe kymatousa TAU-MAC 1615 TaxID=2364775 RepID=A0ABS5Y5M0_9CYAN|nr:hypothetical protein [Leptothoe kymatousa]MBT9313144.1 hypothetical protein [Leptothoe kymatousa TAU-MAC 1615]